MSETDTESLKNDWLKKQPKTEMDYWSLIEELGGHIFWSRHDIHRVPEEKRDKVWDFIEGAQRFQEYLVNEIVEKFGVILPKDSPNRYDKNVPPAPEGKIYYWDWYSKMKREFYSKEYEAIICSACPLSDGLDRVIVSGDIPCSVWRGALFKLTVPYECAMVTTGTWTEKKLFQKIFKKCGKSAITRFLEKRNSLRASVN
ncbi:MAG: hypothetical protein ABIF08_04020 [Nanoarchaeota archaeon]